jgi:hypothetical protein
MNYELSAKPYSFDGASQGFGVSGFGFGAELSGSVSLAPAPNAAASAQETKKLSIVLPKDVHQQAKLLALTEDTTLTALIIDLLRQRIKASLA